MQKRRTVAADHRKWVGCRKRNLSQNLQYCHPTWLAERDYLIAEIDRVSKAPSLAQSGRIWYIYELVYVLIILAVIATRIADWFLKDTPEKLAALQNDPNLSESEKRISSLSKNLFLTHKMIFSLGLLTSFLRVLKVLCAFRTMGIFLRLSALSIESFIQFLLLFIQLYIPLTAAYWALFGGNGDNIHLISKCQDPNFIKKFIPQNVSINGHFVPVLSDDVIFRLTDLSQVAFNLWEIIVANGDKLHPYKAVEPVLVPILFMISSFLITFVGFNIFTALVVFTFKTKYSRCSSLAVISQATTMINYEKQANKMITDHIKNVHKKTCNPMVEPVYQSCDILGEEQSLMQEITKSQRNVHRIFDQVKDTERRYLNALHRKDAEIMHRLQGRMEQFYNKQHAFKTELKKELKEILKKQETFVKNLPKMLEKNAKAGSIAQ